jgi:hypothetical protein
VDFYTTLAQVIPLLLLALAWESEYAKQVKLQRRERGVDVLFWDKRRIRYWTLFTMASAVVAEALIVTVLVGWVGEGWLAEAVVLVALTALLGSLATRIGADAIEATSADDGLANNF